MIPNWNLISNIYPINKTTKILFTNVIDIHSIYKSHLINSTYLATPRTRLEERIARRGDILKSKEKKKNEGWGRRRKFSAVAKVHIFEWLRTGRFQKGRLLSRWGEKRGGGERQADERRRGRERKQERGKKRKQVGR